MQTFQHLLSLGLPGCWDVGIWEALLPTGISGRLWNASRLIRVGVDACVESCVLPSLRTVWCLSAMCCASCLLPLQSKSGSESRIPCLPTLSPFLSLFPSLFHSLLGGVLFDHRGCFFLGFWKRHRLLVWQIWREWRENPSDTHTKLCPIMAFKEQKKNSSVPKHKMLNC